MIKQEILQIEMKKIIIVSIAFMITSCTSQYSKKDHVNTIKIVDGLYLEIFKTSGGGVFASDTYSNYLTDSLHFRKFIGVEHDNDQIRFSILNNKKICIYRVERQNNDTLETKVYNVSELKEECTFE